MKTCHTPIAAIIGCMLFPATAISQDAPATPAKSAGNTQAAGDLGFDDLMTILIGPRHLKLYYAGIDKNWELAAAELRDLRSGLVRLSQRIPKYLNNGVEDAIRVMIEPKLQQLDTAIAANRTRVQARYFDYQERVLHIGMARIARCGQVAVGPRKLLGIRIFGRAHDPDSAGLSKHGAVVPSPSRRSLARARRGCPPLGGSAEDIP